MSDDTPAAPLPGLSRLPPPPARRNDEDEGQEAASDELRPDDLIDSRYRVKGAIGEGGVGRVYRALQVKLGRDVAVKVLQDVELSNPTHRPRFEREAMALASLNHPNIVSVQDYGVWRGRPFLVMEMLEGQSLRERLDRGPLSEREALRITRELLHALAYAHSKGVVHRDLKPANIFLQSFPTQLDHVKVLDFGFAKFVDNNALAGAPALTQAGTTMGTPAYVAPERLYGSEVDGRSDLYSVGILLFEMLSGKKPFDGDISEILRAHLADPVPALSERHPGLGQTEPLTQLFARALAKPVEGRYPDAAAMLAAVDALPIPCTTLEGALAEAQGPRLIEDAEEEAPTRYLSSAGGEASGSGTRGSWLQTLHPLRVRSAARLRRAGHLAWRTTRGLAQQLRALARGGYAWTAPRLRDGSRRVARQAQQWRARLSKVPSAPSLPAGEATVETDMAAADPTAATVPPTAPAEDASGAPSDGSTGRNTPR